MASGFDELIGSLLYDVALAGGRGRSSQREGSGSSHCSSACMRSIVGTDILQVSVYKSLAMRSASSTLLAKEMRHLYQSS